MEIDFILASEYEMGNPDITGTILISDGENRICEEYTYIDTWLYNLIRIYEHITNNGESTSFELDEEINLINLSKEKDRYNIEYKGEIILLPSISAFKKALTIASNHFSDLFGKYVNITSDENNKIIMSFSTKH